MLTKKEFMKAVTVILDSREKEIDHITTILDKHGIAYTTEKLDMGDISFKMGARDFTRACTIERKADVDELYGNIMEKPPKGTMNRLEKEMDAASRTLKQFVLLIEGIGSMDELKTYSLPKWKMDMSPKRIVADIGKPCYERIKAWQAANRYHFRVEFAQNKETTAIKAIEEFYYYYRNYQELLARRG